MRTHRTCRCRRNQGRLSLNESYPMVCNCMCHRFFTGQRGAVERVQRRVADVVKPGAVRSGVERERAEIVPGGGRVGLPVGAVQRCRVVQPALVPCLGKQKNKKLTKNQKDTKTKRRFANNVCCGRRGNFTCRQSEPAPHFRGVEGEGMGGELACCRSCLRHRPAHRPAYPGSDPRRTRSVAGSRRVNQKKSLLLHSVFQISSRAHATWS